MTFSGWFCIIRTMCIFPGRPKVTRRLVAVLLSQKGLACVKERKRF